MAEESKYPTYTLPEAVTNDCFFHIARDYKDNGKFAYTGSIVLEGADADELTAAIDAQITQSKKEHQKRTGAPAPHEPQTIFDEEAEEWEEVPGLTKVKLRVPATTQTKNGPWDRQPVFYDADGKVIDPVAIGAGSRVVIAYQFYRWMSGANAGVTLQPVAIQILELVEPVRRARTRDAGDFGFEKRSGGFTAPAKGTADSRDDVDGDDAGTEGGADF